MRSDTPTPAEAWWTLFRVSTAVTRLFALRANELGLSVPQARALLFLTRSTPVAMSDLARLLPSDPSTVTGLADRLVDLGYLERVEVPGDRRVRGLVLTYEGSKLRRKLIHAALRPPAAVKAAGSDAQRALIEGLGALLDADAAGDLASPAIDAPSPKSLGRFSSGQGDGSAIAGAPQPPLS